MRPILPFPAGSARTGVRLAAARGNLGHLGNPRLLARA